MSTKEGSKMKKKFLVAVLAIAALAFSAASAGAIPLIDGLSLPAGEAEKTGRLL